MFKDLVKVLELRLIYMLIYTAIVILIINSLMVCNVFYAINATSDELHTYVYEFRLNMSINHVVTVSDDLVIAMGYLHGTSVIQFINVSDPFRGPQTIFTYPITGVVTSYAVDGYPVRYVAVGTDLGEVIVFSIDKGRLYEKLHYIQGANFIVSDVYLLRTPTTVKLLTLSINRNLPSERYIYVYDINLRSVLRLGPLVGNLSYAFEGITPYVVRPTKVVDSHGYYYDASRVFVSYTGLTTTLRIYAEYIYNNTRFNASNAYVEIRVLNTTHQLLLIYDTNLDLNGYGEAQVPLGYLIEVALYDIYGNRYTRTVDLVGVKFPEIRTLNFTLLYPPDTRRALRGLPMLIKVFNFSTAPIDYEVITDLTLPGYIGTPFYIFRPLNLRLMERDKPKDPYIILTKHYDYLNMTYMYDDHTLVDFLLYDYLGYGSGDVKFVEVDVNAMYIITALSDGRIRVYRLRDSLYGHHWFEQEYIALGRPLSLRLAFIDGRPYYLLYSTGGLQLVSLEPLQIPLLRINDLLTYNVPEARSADSLPDLSLIAIGGGNRLVLIRGLDTYIRRFGPKPIDLRDVKLPSLTISVLGPTGTGLPNAKVVLTYKGISKEVMTNDVGDAIFSNVFPGEYVVSIYPQEPYLEPLTTNIYVPKTPKVTLQLILNYKTYELSLHLRDEFGIGPQVPLDVYVDGRVMVSNYSLSLLSIKLPYGNYTLTIRPHRGYTYFYEQINTSVTLDRDLTINLTLIRRSYNVTIRLVDAVSRELVDEDVLVIIDDLLLKYVRGFLTTVLKAGRYELKVFIPEELSFKYLSTSTYIDVITDSTTIVEIPRTPYTIDFTLIDELTEDLAIGLFKVYVNGNESLTNVGSKFNITLPYGNYLIEIRPQPPYNAMYSGIELSISLVSNASLTIRLERVKYSLNIRFHDPISKTPITPLILFINDTLHTIPKDTPSYTLSLPYGIYIIRLRPDTGYENVYYDVEDIVNLTRNVTIDLKLSRKYYNLNITIYDVTSGPVLGLLDLEIDGVVVARGITRTYFTSLPYGIYTIRVKPQQPYIAVYSDSEVLVKLFNHTSIDVIINRKYYTLTFVVRDDRDSPIVGADILIIDTVTGSTVGRGISGSDGRFSISLYYGSFRYIIRYSGFYDYIGSLELTTTITEKVTLTPLPITIIIRHLPLIVIASLIIMSMIVLLKLRVKIAERLARTEEVF